MKWMCAYVGNNFINFIFSPFKRMSFLIRRIYSIGSRNKFFLQEKTQFWNGYVIQGSKQCLKNLAMYPYEPWYEKKHQSGIPAQWNLRSGWASTQSNRGHGRILYPSLPCRHAAKTLIRLSGCPGWSESSLRAHATLLVCIVWRLRYLYTVCVYWI